LNANHFVAVVFQIYVNPQTSLLCEMLDITHPNAVFTNSNSSDFLPAQIELDAGSDDTDDVPDDDELPSDISSSLDTSCLSGAMDISYVDSSFNASVSESFASPQKTSAGKSAPLVEVADDDSELQAILVMQKQSSRKSEAGATASPSSKQDSDRSLAENSEARESELSCSSSPKTQASEGEGDEFAIIMAAQRLKKGDTTPSDSDKSGACVSLNKSSSDIEYSSQDSQDEGDRAGSQAARPLSSGVCDSPLAGKRPSPTSNSSSSSVGSAKKLKRRNVSMYSSSGTEEECS
jgi:hypothetical protein